MSKFNGNHFFKTCHLELLRAHKTRDKNDINKLCAKLRLDIRPYAAKIASNYKFTVIDVDDFIQEALIALVRYLPKYRYICPKCDARYELSDEYDKHCENNHGCAMEPRTTLKSFLEGVIRGAILNYKRRHVQKKRTPLATVHIDFFDDLPHRRHNGLLSVYVQSGFVKGLYLKDKSENPEATLISKRAVDSVRRCLDKERNRKIKIFITQILEGLDPGEAYVKMCEDGLSASSESMRITIHQLKRKSNAFEKYKAALVR